MYKHLLHAPLPKGAKATLFQTNIRLLMLIVFSLPTWTIAGLSLLVKIICNPTKAFYKKDRSALKLPDPFPGLRHEFVETNGIKLHTVQAGPDQAGGQKKLMLFVHGFPGCWYDFHKQLKHFKGAYHVCAVTLRGYGESEKPRELEAYFMDELVEDLVGVITGLGYSSCILVAHDWGSGISQFLLHSYPYMVERFVSLGLGYIKLLKPKSASYVRFRLANMLPGLMEATLAFNDYQVMIDNINSVVVDKANKIGEEEAEYYKKALGGASTAAAVGYYRAVAYEQIIQARGKFRGLFKQAVVKPSLFIYGEEDKLFDLCCLKDLGRYIDGAQVKMVPRAAHFITHDAAEAVTEGIQSFIEGKGA